jgi:Holliday junction resolvase RusA-like endonuclease
MINPIILPFPPSSNTAYPTNRRGGRHLSQAGANWKTKAMWQIKGALLHHDPPARFELHIRLWMPDNRRRDVDNYVKLAKDALCDALAVEDNWQRIPRLSVEACGVDRDNPRCELTLEPCPDALCGQARRVDGFPGDMQ